MSSRLREHPLVTNVPNVKMVGVIEAGGKKIFREEFLPHRACDASRELKGNPCLVEESTCDNAVLSYKP